MHVLHTVSSQTAPLFSSSVGVGGCLCVKEREIPALGGPKMVSRERQTHLDMADGQVCMRVCAQVPERVQYVCVSGWGYRSGWGLVQSSRQGSHPRLDLGKAQINTNMNSSFLPMFHRIANTHLWCGSEGVPPYTAYSVPAVLHAGLSVHFNYNLKIQANSWILTLSSVLLNYVFLFSSWDGYLDFSYIFLHILITLHFLVEEKDWTL